MVDDLKEENDALQKQRQKVRGLPNLCSGTLEPAIERSKLNLTTGVAGFQSAYNGHCILDTLLAVQQGHGK